MRRIWRKFRAKFGLRLLKNLVVSDDEVTDSLSDYKELRLAHGRTVPDKMIFYAQLSVSIADLLDNGHVPIKLDFHKDAINADSIITLKYITHDNFHNLVYWANGNLTSIEVPTIKSFIKE